MTSYEEQTNEFRQVRRERRLPRSGDCVAEYHLQRKWVIAVAPCEGPNGEDGMLMRDEWRDVPVIDSEDAL